MPLTTLDNCRLTSLHPEESLRKGMSESLVPVTSMRIVERPKHSIWYGVDRRERRKNLLSIFIGSGL